MKEITKLEVKNIFLFYGVSLTAEEIEEETSMINSRLQWDDGKKTASEICHQYALQRSALDFGDLL